jgi:hypothetical protein
MGTSMCKADGDEKALCIENQCDYDCDCSTGFDYNETTGTCVDHDSCEDGSGEDKCWEEEDDDFANQRNNDHTCVDTPAPSLYKKAPDDTVEDWGYVCYCACGFVFSMHSGTCESCMVEGMIMVQGDVEIADSNGLASATNDISRVFLKIDMDGTGFEINQINVNLNNAAGNKLVTRVNNFAYSLDSPTRPAPEEFGVVEGIPLKKQFTGGETSWLFSITLSDIDFDASCNLNVMVYLDLTCVDSDVCTVDQHYEGWVMGMDTESVVNDGTAEWFSYMAYTPCGLSEAVGGGHCTVDMGSHK